MSGPAPMAWRDAVEAAAVLAVAPHAVGGIVLRATPGPLRARWLELFKALLGPLPLRRMPAAIAEGRLLGELDLAATLATNRPCAAPGLLAEANGGLVVAAMAERLPPSVVSPLAAALDRGVLRIEREGLGAEFAAAIGVVALDEGVTPDERVPAALCDRLAIWLELDQMAFEADTLDLDAARVAAARALLPDVQADAASLDMLCATALGVGAFSLRVPLLARTVARCAAALAGRTAVLEDDLIFAARLVIAPRATLLPASAEDETAPDPTQEEAEPHEATPSNGESDQADATTGGALEDKVLSACVAAIPPHLLASLTGGMDRQKAAHAGRSGVTQRGLARGRPVGTRAGAPRRGARLDLIATLRAAAPWQPLRRRAATSAVRPRVIVMADDFRIVRFKQQVEATIVFVVDASGSAAVQRLAEAKGAVEMLLADCYIRRDQVALLAFRRTAAELLLPPTRSLARVKRSLAGLPGGGGTPIAAGLEAALHLSVALKGKGRAPQIVLLTDGRANVARDGTTGRAAGEADALAMARLIRVGGVPSLLIDTGPRPQRNAKALAAAMGAVYLPLPLADPGRLAGAVRAAMAG